MGVRQCPVANLVTDGPSRRTLGDVLEQSYRDRRVLVTGHNGFVGSWLSYWLARTGAEVTGLALAGEPAGLAESLGIDALVDGVEADIRDEAAVDEVFRRHAPEIVFHLAAQALVLPSFDDPVGTVATNVMGTAHVLDAVRRSPEVRCCVVVTSDKCYAEATGAHVETDALGGEDPYSASKAAGEIVTHAFASSYFSGSSVGLATARAGNIVGGGDWAEHRIVPDCVRAIRDDQPVVLRHPEAVRPWQHVLDAVAGYLRLGDALMRDPARHSGPWNFGPPAAAAATVSEVVAMLVDRWRALGGSGIRDPVVRTQAAVRERSALTLVSEKAISRLDWSPMLDLRATIEWTVDWYHSSLGSRGESPAAVTSAQIDRYLELEASRRALGPSAKAGGR